MSVFNKNSFTELNKAIKALKEEAKKYQKEENAFNVFTTLLLPENEVYLHSRFISSILDPNGTHDLGTKPLEIFLQTINSKLTPTNLDVIPNMDTWTEYKEIDILITNKDREIDNENKVAIIVENKINAKESNHNDEGQLGRYYRRLIEEDYIPRDNIEVYYLSPDRRMPSDDSTNTMNNKYADLREKVKLIDYKTEISSWVDACSKEAYNRPYVREVLLQYNNVIKKISAPENMEEVVETIVNALKDDNGLLESIESIIDSRNDLKTKLWKMIFDSLKTLLEEKQFEVELGNGGICSLEFKYMNYKWQFQVDSHDDKLYYGLPDIEENKDNIKELEKRDTNEWNLNGDTGWIIWKWMEPEPNVFVSFQNILTDSQQFKLLGSDKERYELCDKYFNQAKAQIDVLLNSDGLRKKH